MSNADRLWTIDAGNSSIKFALMEDGHCLYAQRFDRPSWQNDSSIVKAAQKMAGEFPGAAGVAICCARQADADPVVQIAENLRAKTNPLLAGPARSLPFTFVYTSGSPGPDRLANAAALQKLSPGRPSVAIDFGTATHGEIMSADGEFLGGIIFPGIRVQLGALAPATGGRLPNLDSDTARDATACNNSTDSAIRSGILIAQAAAAERFAAEAAAELDEIQIDVYITGGGASLVMPLLRLTYRHEPWLTMTGLEAIWRAAH
jgi:type III pantothenate kinase